MQRFGRTGHQKMKDGWGGSYILGAILILAAAFWIGTSLNNLLNPSDTASGPSDGVAKGPGNGSMVVADPHPFQLYFVQAGAFRSESGARNLVQNLAGKGYTAMLTAKDQSMLNHVYAGVYTSKENAESAAAKLLSDGMVTEKPYIAAISVEHNPDSVPAAATGDATNVKNGMDLLNSYLYEAALWLENRAVDTQATTAAVSNLGRQLGDLALNMTSQKDDPLKNLANLATSASLNARDIELAATNGLNSQEYQAATSGYLVLLDQYRNLHTGN